MLETFRNNHGIDEAVQYTDFDYARFQLLRHSAMITVSMKLSVANVLETFRNDHGIDEAVRCMDFGHARFQLLRHSVMITASVHRL